MKMVRYQVITKESNQAAAEAQKIVKSLNSYGHEAATREENGKVYILASDNLPNILRLPDDSNIIYLMQL